MQAFRKSSAAKLPALPSTLPIAVNLTLSIGTLPMLGLLISGRWAAERLTQLGFTSEELFRGERLPLLPLMAPASADAPPTDAPAIAPKV